MFHYTKLDMFCNDVVKFADADGYVPEAEDICQDFSYPEAQFNSLKNWTQHIKNSVNATHSAEKKLIAWRHSL
jgi:hypothetical protein